MLSEKSHALNREAIVRTKVEQVLSPEISSVEKVVENKKEDLSQIKEKIKSGGSGIAGDAQRIVNSRKHLQEIEQIMSGGLEEVYTSLSQSVKIELKKRGEETAKAICVILESTKVSVHKIINLLRKWLLIIPRLNKFFVEQAVKIKTDEMLKVKNRW